MPAKFKECIAKGGKVRTVKIGTTKFMPICFVGGKSFPGEVRTRKKKR